MTQRITVYPSFAAAEAALRKINGMLRLPRQDWTDAAPSAVEFGRAYGHTTSACTLIRATDGSQRAALIHSDESYALNGQRGLRFDPTFDTLPAAFRPPLDGVSPAPPVQLTPARPGQREPPAVPLTPPRERGRPTVPPVAPNAQPRRDVSRRT